MFYDYIYCICFRLVVVCGSMVGIPPITADSKETNSNSSASSASSGGNSSHNSVVMMGVTRRAAALVDVRRALARVSETIPLVFVPGEAM